MNLIRGRDVDDAITMLRFSKQRASGMIEKVVRSAVANAAEQDVRSRNALFVQKCWVDPGPVIKRFQPKDRGKAYSIMKRTSHLVVTLDERADENPAKGAKPVKGKR
jgi:large subunit ribosomal protein L22